MTFTDDDLKRLKDHIACCGENCQTCCEMLLPCLINRLRAAEEFILDGGLSQRKLQAWRKAAGK